MRVTQLDIARKAKVSQATVSRVLAGDETVDLELRDRVAEVMRKSNYHLNKRASSLRKKMSGLIGLVLKRPEGGLRDDPFVSCLISEITEVLAGTDFHLCVDLAHTAEEQSRIYDEMLRTDRVDGVILVEPEADDKRLERLLADEFPFVVIGNPANAVVSSVDNDNVMAGRMAALHLVESGCRQVGMLAGPKDVQVSSDRVLGYNFAMQQAGQEPMICHSEFGHKAAEKTAARLLSKPDRLDGLVVLDDHMAVGAAAAIRSAGLTIPNDVALVSFNNSSLCDLVEGGLSSVDLNVESLIRQAARMLLKRVESKNGAPISRRVVPCELVRRGSSSPTAQGRCGMILSSLIAGAVFVQSHEFVFTTDRDLDSVNVAGTFNGWSSTANDLVRGADGRRWSTSLDIGPGRHQYKFVLNGDEWIVDPKATLNEDDGNGNTNSILLIVPPGYDAPAVRGDGTITASSLHHDPSLSSSSWHRGVLTLNLRARAGDVTRISVAADVRTYEAEVGLSDELYETHSVQVPWDRSKDISYTFQVQDGHALWHVGVDGVTAGKPEPFAIEAKSFRPFLTPAWSEGAVFYQIFPDRFANGSLSNDPENVFNWDQDPTYYGFHGGDLAGIRSHTDYLSSLGIDAVYMTPVFEGPSNHRYETVSYFKVDHRLGDNKEFSELTRHLKQAGIRTVLDGVFNHTGTDFFAFADVRESGAESPYADWYMVHDYPVRVESQPNYEAFYGFPSMPKLNTLNPYVQSHIFEAMTFWHKNAEIAGWRLDVANEVAMPFWRRYRRHMKSLSADQLIIGEHWGDGTPWLKGDQWDSMMGYQFREAALQWIARGNGSPTKYLETLIGIYRSYPPQVSGNLMNLIGSHDTPRFLNMAGGDKELLKLAQTMLLTWPGAPCIYYGDELGMAGGADPDNRRGMRWDLASDANDVLAHVRRLTALRKSSSGLTHGEPKIEFSDDERQVGAFSRTYKGETALVAVSRSSHPETVVIPLSKRLRRWASTTPLRDGLTDKPIALTAHGDLRVELPPKGSAVVLPEDLVLALSN